MIHYNDTCNLLIILKPTAVFETIIIPEEYNLLLAQEELESNDASEYLLKDIGVYLFKKGDDQ